MSIGPATVPRRLMNLSEAAADPLLKLIALSRADTRPDKIDLGVGVYRNADGRTPIMSAVAAAQKLLGDRQDTLSYVGATGDEEFLEQVAGLIFGPLQTALGERLVGVQAVGGTGALWLAGELLRASGATTIWLGFPSWPNHVPILRRSRLTVREAAAFDIGAQTLDWERFLTALEDAAAGDAILVQACCHNPTGADMSLLQWSELAEVCQRKGLIPLIDLAYLGLGRGVAADVEGLRLMVDSVPECLVAVSCAKSFGIYRERAGALFLTTETAKSSAIARSHVPALARPVYSMPPDRGAALVRTVLQDPVLRAMWNGELDLMRERIGALRGVLADAFAATGLGWTALRDQAGMFSTLPLSVGVINALRQDGVYMTDSGRVNIAGMRAEDAPRLAVLITRAIENQGAHG